MNRTNKKDLFTLVFYRLKYRIFIMLIIAIGIIKSCTGSDVDPMDHSINKSREVFSVFPVTDSTGNGFELTYATKEAVTKERFTEIKSREYIYSTFDKLKSDAQINFPDMLYTDIHDFAFFALKFNPDKDIYLDHIFVYGYQKEIMYIGKNPKIENSASWYNAYTKQGIQYITHRDFFYCQDKEKRTYRYWRCYGLHSTSSKDERYSHFSEDERL